jgi:hypothetical protein
MLKSTNSSYSNKSNRPIDPYVQFMTDCGYQSSDSIYGKVNNGIISSGTQDIPSHTVRSYCNVSTYSQVPK